MEDLHQRFAIATPAQKVNLLAEALSHDAGGIELLIEALNEDVLTVRATAYSLLQA